MQKIYIYPKASFSVRGVAIGLDRQVLSFQKKKSTILKENLKKCIREREITTE